MQWKPGMIIPLDDLVADTENLGKDPRLTLRNEYRKEHMYTDGHFYSIGGWGGMGMDQLPGAANWIRWDLYKEAAIRKYIPMTSSWSF